MVTRQGRYNSAIVIDKSGELIGWQHKMQLVPPDEEAGCLFGEKILLFEVAGIKASIIICHDKRYPELCRLPVLAGSRLIL
jgi:predicted amidohydrolase